MAYSLTPLSPEGATKIGADLAPEGFAEMLRKWEGSIRAMEAPSP